MTMLLAAAVAVLFLLTACGSKSNSASSATDTTTTAETTTAAETTPAPTTTPADTTTTSESTVTATTSTDTGSSSGSSTTVPKSCLNFAQAASKLGQALAAGGASASANAESLKTYFNGLAEKAPSDIKSAFQTLANAISKYVDAIKGMNLQPGKTPSASEMAKLQSVIGSLSKPDVQAASNKIQAWVKAGCHS